MWRVCKLLDVSDITSPLLVAQIPLDAPRGLAVVGDDLFVTDGLSGLLWFDVSDRTALNSLDGLVVLNPLDVLVRDGWGAVLNRDHVIVFEFDEIDGLTTLTTLE